MATLNSYYLRAHCDYYTVGDDLLEYWLKILDEGKMTREELREHLDNYETDYVDENQVITTHNQIEWYKSIDMSMQNYCELMEILLEDYYGDKEEYLRIILNIDKTKDFMIQVIWRNVKDKIEDTLYNRYNKE